ncbi:NAD(P)H-hydrate epimerase [Streptomyces lonarensis]|uniref:Bifunctional NAD(P)H-hydrate repair enzyme n=1 Tax=Streptomyces lonarensis TaxID=700599 RepID=A0A7X6D4Q3_9ACTN|nr:NAD(P)H-hydrate epimerase [Streptomyces lonarensis]NJQ08035.1 NAD(P)H-hydrate epimerase [Streptomyces lonarensis]
MRIAYSVHDVRAAERRLMERLPDGALMQRAAAGLAAVCVRTLGRVSGARVVLLVGSGDNGGDALYAGARLARRGAGVLAVLLGGERVHAGGLAALRRAGGRTVEPAGAEGPLARADLVVDGIVGIGGRGGLRPEAARVARLAAACGAPLVAVDLPSGIDAGTGRVEGDAVRADVTVTFGAHKPGLLVDPGRGHAGVVHLVDIGLGPELATVTPVVRARHHQEVAALLPVPGPESDKYRRGVVGVAAGSERYPGAAVLAVAGALRGGAGAVRYVGPPAEAVLARFPEVLIGPGRVQAWVAGSGLGDAPEARERLARALDDGVSTVVDADGLRMLGPAPGRTARGPLVLTPHAGEAAALLGVAREEVEEARLESVRQLARQTGATVLLKGSTTLIASPPGEADAGEEDGGTVLANLNGTGWLATAGTGDVLAGLIGSLLAAGLAPADAAAVGAHLHGLAGSG